jgi:hypothetical protein
MSEHEKPMGFGEADEASDSRIAHLLLAEEGATNPSPEMLASISPELIARRRAKLVEEANAQLAREQAESPEGKIAQARADELARQERGRAGRAGTAAGRLDGG